MNEDLAQAALRGLRGNFITEIEAMEQRAHNLGMLVTARALNNAKNSAGWEMAGDILAAGKAAAHDGDN